MAITIDWLTKIINVPRADMTLVQASPEIRALDVNSFRLELKDIEDGEGMPFLDTHQHNPPVTVGGVTLARTVEIINGYTITFEDGQYAVNLSGANNNVADVTNINQVSVRSANSGGLVVTDTSGLTAGEAAMLQLIVNLLEADEEFGPSTARKLLRGTSTVLVEKQVTGGNLSGTITVKD